MRFRIRYVSDLAIYQVHLRRVLRFMVFSHLAHDRQRTDHCVELQCWIFWTFHRYSFCWKMLSKSVKAHFYLFIKILSNKEGSPSACQLYLEWFAVLHRWIAFFFTSSCNRWVYFWHGIFFVNRLCDGHNCLTTIESRRCLLLSTSFFIFAFASL